MIIIKLNSASLQLNVHKKMDNTDQPISIYHVEQIYMYPLQSIDNRYVPFPLLAGENIKHSGTSVDGPIFITNYRLYLQSGKNHYQIPVGLIETVETRELFYLSIGCKDSRTYRCSFQNNEECLEWSNRILKAAEAPKQVKQAFAYYNFVWAKQKDIEGVMRKLKNQRKYNFGKEVFEREMIRLQFRGDSWRISKANENYELCKTYPGYLTVPSCINDSDLKNVANFRSSQRIPVVVWRHSLNGAVIARCSQPEVGWLGWRSADDEELIKAISQACNFDRAQQKDTGGGGGPDGRGSNLSRSPESQKSNESLQITSDIKATENCIKVLIMDARSYTTAVANRARGGGCECPEYYPNCEIRFMNLANIHSIRKSFHALRQLCAASGDQPNWFTQLEGTRWLLHMSGLMNAAVTLVTAIDQDGRPVLVHCSDGWDRTPQIVALAELLLDPYYRTLEGFRILIEREWLAFGHKFADRCGLASGSDDQNERCPVFLQWLDCVHQVVTQFPCAFEFSQTYLVKLAQHTYSNLFGTFLCNTQQERLKSVNDNTFSVWDFLDLPCFRNYLYTPVSNATAVDVLWPQCDIRDLKLWKEVYIGSMEANFNAENGPGPHPGPSGLSPRHMTKTRSYGDLKSAEGTCPNHYRRCSDPSINCDSNLTNHDSEPLHASSQVISIPNGHTLRQPDFYPSDLEDADCKQDCLMFDNNSDHLTDDQIDGLDQADFEEPSTSLPDINDHVTNGEGDVTINLFDRKVILKTDLFRDKPGIAPRSKLGRTVLHRDLPRNENGILKCEVGNSSKESENSGEDSLSRNSEGASSSQNTKCETTILSADVGGEVCGLSEVERSVETSTETLVSEKLVCSSSPKEINGFEKIQSPVGDSEMTDACAQDMKFSEGAHSLNYSHDQSSRYSSSPFYSNSSNGWDSTLQNLSQQKNFSYQYTLGEDGLIPLRCVVQERLYQIIEEHKRKVDLLEKELHATRQNLIRQSCHRCNHNDSERQDDNSSVVESVFSASEGQASAGESQRSDLSWVAVEEASLADCQTLWVPDHAVSRCTGCGTEFWLGRRRHHCRKCGKIFCADCSENSTPLPSEQLYNPVRVCTGCYSELRRDCGEIPNQCKHTNTQTTNTNPQIAASSN